MQLSGAPEIYKRDSLTEFKESQDQGQQWKLLGPKWHHKARKYKREEQEPGPEKCEAAHKVTCHKHGPPAPREPRNTFFYVDQQ
jgi:hypothetical protein